MAVRRGATVDIDDYLTDDEDVEVKSSAAAASFDEDDPNEVGEHPGLIQGGWGAAKKAMTSGNKSFTSDFRLGEDTQLIKFMSPDPIAVYRQHWVNERTEGKKSFICLGAKCPLCRVAGHKADQKIAFSILNVSSEGMEVQLWAVGPRLAEMLDQNNRDSRLGPLDRGYWAVKKSGKGPKTSYSINPVKERDVPDDFDIDPRLVDERLKEAEVLDTKAIRLSSYEDLMAVALEIAHDAD